MVSSIVFRLLLAIASSASSLENSKAIIQSKVEALGQKGDALLNRIGNDPEASAQLKALINEVYSLDPNNEKAASWASKLDGTLGSPKKIAPNLEKYKKSLEERPTDTALLREAADYSFSIKDYGRASLLYHKLLSLDPTAKGANARLADIAQNAMDADSAKKYREAEAKISK